MTRTRPPQPQVSVIVPVYNQEQYLEECITAIRRQTLAERECIIVNDGSSDSSGEIARRFSEEDSRIRCFEQENRGVSSARNLGMRHASGRYLCFVDGDDFIDAAFLKHLLDASDRGASDLTVAGKLFCDRFPPDKIPALPTCGISMLLEVQDRQKENVPAEVFQKRNRHAPNPRIHSLFCKEAPPIIPVTAVFPVFIYSYQQHDHLLPGNDRMLVIGSSALAKNHGHLKSSRLAADTLIFNFPLNHPRLWRQMEHSLSGARYSIILFMWPPLHLSPANGRLMEKPPEGGGPMESAEDMLCRLFAFLRKQTRILLIGDSVMRHLWRPLASELQEDIDLFSSTLIPGDPDYLPTLAGYFPSAGYEAVIVSFGSHVTNKVSAISVDDFRKNYMAFVSQLSKRCRFLILATSTSIMDGPDGTLNEEKEKIITAFNAIVREAASSLPGAVLSDHHDFMQGRRYIDPFHFSPPDRAYQAGKTAGLLLPLLSARQEPPKEQECPQSRPEP